MSEVTTKSSIRDLEELLKQLDLTTKKAKETNSELQAFVSKIDYSTVTADINKFYDAVDKFDGKLGALEGLSKTIATIQGQISGLATQISGELTKGITDLNNAVNSQSGSAKSVDKEQIITAKEYVENTKRLLELKNQLGYANQADLDLMKQQLRIAQSIVNLGKDDFDVSNKLVDFGGVGDLDAKAVEELKKSQLDLLQTTRDETEATIQNKLARQQYNQEIKTGLQTTDEFIEQQRTIIENQTQIQANRKETKLETQIGDFDTPQSQHIRELEKSYSDMRKAAREAQKAVDDEARATSVAGQALDETDLKRAVASATVREYEQRVKMVAEATVRLNALETASANIRQRLANATGLTANEIKKMNQDLKQYEKQIKVEKRTIEDFSSSVGTAEHSLRRYNAAQMNLIQVIREMPNFFISVRTGLMSLSNNLPMLAESFMKTTKWAGFLARNIVWLNLLFVVLTTMLMKYKEIAQFFKDLVTNAGDLTKAIRKTTENISKNMGELQDKGEKVLKIFAALKATSIVDHEKQEALKKYNKEFGKTFGIAKDTAEAVELLTDKTEAYFQILVLGMIETEVLKTYMKDYGKKVIKDIEKSFSSGIGKLEEQKDAAIEMLNDREWMNEVSVGEGYYGESKKSLYAAYMEEQIGELKAVMAEYGITFNDEQRKIIEKIRNNTVLEEEVAKLYDNANLRISTIIAEGIMGKESFKKLSNQTQMMHNVLNIVKQAIAKSKGINLFGDDGGDKGLSMRIAQARALDIAYKEYSEQAEVYRRKLESLERVMSEEGATTEKNSMKSRIDAWTEYFELRKKIANETLIVEAKNAGEAKRKDERRLKEAVSRTARARRDIQAALSNETDKSKIADLQDRLDEVVEAEKTNAQSRINIQKNYYNKIYELTDNYVAQIQKDYYEKLEKYHEVLASKMSDNIDELKRTTDRAIADITREFEDISLVIEYGFLGTFIESMMQSEEQTKRLKEALKEVGIELGKMQRLSFANMLVDGLTNSKAPLADYNQQIAEINAKYAETTMKNELKLKQIRDEMQLRQDLIDKMKEQVGVISDVNMADDPMENETISGIVNSVFTDEEQNAEARIALAMSLQSKLVEIQDLSLEEQGAALVKHTAEITDLSKEQQDILQENLEAKAKKDRRLIKLQKDAIKEMTIDFMQAVVEMLDALVEAQIEHERQMLEAWQEQHSTRIEEQLKSEVISQEQAEAQKEALAYEVRKREHEIAKKEDSYQKTRALFDIGLATAVGIANIWGQWAWNPIVAGALTALMSAMTLAQMVTVLAKPVPAFAEGVFEYDPSNYYPLFGQNKALVGEKGAEMRITKSGQMELITQPQIVSMNRGDTIIPNGDLAMLAMLMSANRSTYDGKEQLSEQRKANQLLRRIAEKDYRQRSRNYNLYWR